MMTAIVEQTKSETSQQVPPSVLLVGKKRTMDYVAPALYRINNTSELIIKATGSLSIVTAVDVAEIVKRDVTDITIQSIKIGTDELRIASGELKRMSCIEIHLIKISPIAVAAPDIEDHVPKEEVPPAVVEVPILEVASYDTEVPVVLEGKIEKKPKAKRKSSTAKKTKRKKKSTKASHS